MQSHLYPETMEEKLIWWGLIYTYPVYLFGGLYVTGSVLGWLVISIAFLRWYVEGKDDEAAIPVIVWIWVLAMGVMLVALWVAHINWNLGMGKTIKSSIGWAKGWALMAVFPVIGAIIKVKPELIIRGVCIVSFHTFIFACVTYVAYLARIPGELYISPLQIVGGPGENFFMVSLYGLNPETGAGRWQFFGPWAPAAGFMACVYLVFCLQEKNIVWKRRGIAGCVFMILLSQSRAGLGIFIMLFPMFFLCNKLRNPLVVLSCGIGIPLILILGEPIYEFFMDSYQQIKEQRPASTRVRSALANIAKQRWISEAPIWGHGIVERGPKLVEGMPIGSHHSWYGLLFVKGIVGLVSLAIPLGISLIYLFWQAQYNDVARTGFCLVMIFICYSFYENLEILSYLFWPALLWVGIALNPLKSVGLTKKQFQY